MRIERSVTSVSWIPSESIPGFMKLAFKARVSHYDQPPPAVLEDLDALRRADRFRFANELRAWIEVGEDGQITDFGYSGRGHMGSTTMRLGPTSVTFAGIARPDLQSPPEIGPNWVRFVQTAGGRTGAPAPQPVLRPPFITPVLPDVWTTLALVIRSEGTCEHEVVGASPFPRHWIYDENGRLVKKVSVASFRGWVNSVSGRRNPWRGKDAQPLVSEAESELERLLSGQLMQGDRAVRHLRAGEHLVTEGDSDREIYLVLDGLLEVEVGGRVVGRVGPGAIVGERSHLHGRRTATLRAVTPCRVAESQPERFHPDHMQQLAASHRAEEKGTEAE